MTYSKEREDHLRGLIDSSATHLEVDKKLIITFLESLVKLSPVENKKILRLLGLPKIHFYRLLASFTEILDKNPKAIILSPLWKDVVIQVLSDINKVGNISNYESKLRALLVKIKKERPRANRDFDQFTATINTTIKRGKILLHSGDIWDSNVAILGDDDLTSIAVALSGIAKRITVFEIDERLIALIKSLAERYELPIEVIKADLRMPIGNEFREQFDLVFTDPPYTPVGIGTFLNQAIGLLHKKFTSKIYLCYGNSDRAREREVLIQEEISKRGLLVKSKVFQFNKYIGAESIGSSSSLYVLNWTPMTKAKAVVDKNLYTHE